MTALFCLRIITNTQLLLRDKFKNQSDFNDIMKNPGKVPYIDKNQKIKYGTAPRAPMPKANFVETNKILGR